MCTKNDLYILHNNLCLHFFFLFCYFYLLGLFLFTLILFVLKLWGTFFSAQGTFEWKKDSQEDKKFMLSVFKRHLIDFSNFNLFFVILSGYLSPVICNQWAIFDLCYFKFHPIYLDLLETWISTSEWNFSHRCSSERASSLLCILSSWTSHSEKDLRTTNVDDYFSHQCNIL